MKNLNMNYKNNVLSIIKSFRILAYNHTKVENSIHFNNDTGVLYYFSEIIGKLNHPCCKYSKLHIISTEYKFIINFEYNRMAIYFNNKRFKIQSKEDYFQFSIINDLCFSYEELLEIRKHIVLTILGKHITVYLHV